MSKSPVKIGVIGCGNISAVYFKAGQSLDILDIVACADLDMERARARAEEFSVPRACTVDELLADPEIEIVLNLTIPKAHAEIALAALEAGKHVYNEKPLALSRQDGRRMLEMARRRGPGVCNTPLRVGCAPDTFLGDGLQTCRRLIDEGVIGEPIGAAAFMMNHGHEGWHPDPDFYYQPGGGPMFDMGPYYLTALVFLIGPVRRVTGSVKLTFPERTITSAPKYGTTIKVKTPTHVTGVLDFAGGAVGTMTTSFDVWGSALPRLEIYGTEGTLSAPDPNTFGGPVRVLRAGATEWSEVPLVHSSSLNNRGIGLADMADALRSGRPHRASGALAYHVLDIMHAFYDAADQGRHIVLSSTCSRPEPVGDRR